MLCKVTHCAGRVSANTRPHQLHWGDQTLEQLQATINESNIPADTHFKPEWRLTTLVQQHILQF